MVAVEGKSGDRQSHLGTINVCTQFHVNPFKSCCDISLWDTAVDQLTDQH